MHYAICVFRQVLNSIDAKATQIQVWIDLETFSVKVEDDGEGLSKENLDAIGIRYVVV